MPKAKAGEAQVTVTLSLRLPPEDIAVLRAHAYLRNVKMNPFLSDLLRGWIVSMTDFNSPYFDEKALGFRGLPMPQDRYPRYLESLGYVVPEQAEGEQQVLPKTGTHDHHDATVTSDLDTAFLGAELPNGGE